MFVAAIVSRLLATRPAGRVDYLVTIADLDGDHLAIQITVAEVRNAYTLQRRNG